MSINKKKRNPCFQKTIGFLCKAGGGGNKAQGPFCVKKLIIDRPYFAFIMMRNFDLTAWEPDSPATRINIPPWVTHTGCVVFFTGFCWALSPPIDISLASGVMFLPRAGVREGLYPPPPSSLNTFISPRMTTSAWHCPRRGCYTQCTHSGFGCRGSAVARTLGRARSTQASSPTGHQRNSKHKIWAIF